MKIHRADVLVLVLILAILCNLSISFSAEGKTETEIKARVERYLTRYFKLAPQESITVNDIWSVQDPPMWGLSVTRNQGGSLQNDVYMLTKDLKILTLGRALDFTKDLDAENLAKVSLQDAPSTGPDQAPVVMVIFCDYQCPDCKVMAQNLKQVLPGFPGRVRLVFKNFPLMSKHAWAEDAAIAAQCAYVQRPSAFWAYFDFFFSEQNSMTVQNLRRKVMEVGTTLKLDTGKLAACFDTRATLPALQRDLFEAAKLGVKGTPTLLVNGRFVFNEEMTEKDYRKLIEEALTSRP
jgi:protein-disulfide isomerase